MWASDHPDFQPYYITKDWRIVTRIPRWMAEIFIEMGVLKEEATRDSPYYAPCGGKWRYVYASAGEWGLLMQLGLFEAAAAYLEKPWQIYDQGWDVETEVRGRMVKLDAKAVPHPNNPVLMIRHYKPREKHPPYKFDVAVNMWVRPEVRDSPIVTGCGMVGWMNRLDALAAPVRVDYMDVPLNPHAHCVPHWLQNPMPALDPTLPVKPLPAQMGLEL